MLIVPVLALVVLLTGCGSGESSSSAPSADKDDRGAPSTASVGRCPVDSPAVTDARPIAKADLDGDGRSDLVKLTAAGGDCSSFVFARLSEALVTTQLPADAPPLSEAFGVEVPGMEGALLATRQDHPRGGFQLRLYAVDGGKLVELKTRGRSLVPFIALDIQEHPLSIDCVPGGVVVTEAVAHEPAGVASAWDVRRTSYAVEGAEVTEGESAELADNVMPGELEADYPELVRHTLFESCRTAA
jgi:hypothetical protein